MKVELLFFLTYVGILNVQTLEILFFNRPGMNVSFLLIAGLRFEVPMKYKKKSCKNAHAPHAFESLRQKCC